MYDPISGQGKIPPPDYSEKEWYREWLQELRVVDARIERECRGGIKEPTGAKPGRKRMYTPEEIKAKRRERQRARYHANHAEMLRKGAERRAKQKALRTAATVTQDREQNTTIF